jgi:23S rRNA pseudouridine955/2504/2580 synthase|tara:strand:- start:962 stop:1873 length:912 start_codon:yes stop_codon:yes gene_type:complete
MKKSFLVTDDFVNTRLDRWFKKNITQVPQSLLEKSIRKGNIKINNKKTKSSYKLKKKDQIIIHNINFKENQHKEKQKKYVASKSDLNKSSGIFIENNENFVVINKPAGIAVQSGTKSRKNIIDILRSTQEFETFSPYTVHRIDKETTGILIVAKNRRYAQLFTSLFRIRKIHKTYLCVVLGQLQRNKGTLEDELIYYENEKKIKAIAVTRYVVLDTNNNFSLLKLNPITGKKHQLRKQLLINGNPILGDTKYRIKENYHSRESNLMLHAHKISFSIDGVKHSYSADLPLYFTKFLNEKYLKTS